jgi:hypothetical protein
MQPNSYRELLPAGRVNKFMRAEEFTQSRVMAKIEKTGQIVQILRHQDGDFLINTNPDTKSHMGVKWIPDTTRFVWVKRFDSLKESKTATAQQVLDYINQTHHESLIPKLEKTVLSHPQWQLQQVPLLNLNIPDEEYDDVEQDPESDPYGRVMAVDPGHAGEVSLNLIDKRPIVIDANRYIIDGNHRAWAAKNLLNRDYISAWVPVEHIAEITRRDFLRGAGAMAGTAALGSVQAQPNQDTTKIINSAAILWAICKKHYPNNPNTRALEETVKRLWKNKSDNAVAFNEEYTAMKVRLADWETRDPAGYAKFVNRYMMNFAKIKADLETLPEMMI